MVRLGSERRERSRSAQPPHRPGQFVDGERGELAQLPLQVGLPLLDGVEVRAVGRQVHHTRSHRFDSLTPLVRGGESDVHPL